MNNSATQFRSGIPADDLSRNLTLVGPNEDAKLKHVALAGDNDSDKMVHVTCTCTCTCAPAGQDAFFLAVFLTPMRRYRKNKACGDARGYTDYQQMEAPAAR